MIFRDKRTGTLLNIRRDDYTNDEVYFKDIIRIVTNNTTIGHITPRYTRPFDEVITEGLR